MCGEHLKWTEAKVKKELRGKVRTKKNETTYIEKWIDVVILQKEEPKP